MHAVRVGRRRYLFMTFGDGFIASPKARPPRAPAETRSYTPGGTSTVSVKENGYDDQWCALLLGAHDLYLSDI